MRLAVAGPSLRVRGETVKLWRDGRYCGQILLERCCFNLSECSLGMLLCVGRQRLYVITMFMGINANNHAATSAHNVARIVVRLVGRPRICYS